ncbi:hypothetical protein [Sphingomonas adhaesiva]|uniref:hypothetical protein n=1 Tax=Sphingomonas adhaesiva TaxID=28212 RepID=UPI002FF53C8E
MAADETTTALPNARGDRGAAVLRAIYALCLAGATYNHWSAIYRHGWLWDYGGYPRVSTTFWTMLGVVDPLAVLLLVRPRIGVVATVAIIVTDVVHNIAVIGHYFPPLLTALATVPSLIAQIVFMVFVLATCRRAAMIRRVRASRPSVRRAFPAGERR